jgi:2-polyprenyl-3-methyl-5-hydroxy-6-metoxy-1,4-benzoquinol methylase
MNKINKKINIITCPICNENKTRLLFKTGQFKIPVNVSICLNDGLVYLNPRWNKKNYDNYYKQSYNSYYRNNMHIQKIIDIKNGKEIFNRLSTMPDFNPTSILDVGAGMGDILKYLDNNFRSCQNIAAIEVSDECINNLQNNVGAVVISKNIESSQFDDFDSNYDLIILRHSLEHMLDPINTLNKINNLLSKNGILYIAVPDMMNPTGSLKFDWFRAVHTYYFNKETLSSIMKQSGFSSLKINSENHELWGCFYKINKNNIQNFEFNSIYHKQLELIESYTKNYYYLDGIEYVKQSIIGILPEKIRKFLREKYLNLKFRDLDC